VAPEGYLRGVLADGARPFRYRAGVRMLLGLPGSGGVQVSFAPTAPGTNHVYMDAAYGTAAYLPGEAPADPWPSDPWPADAAGGRAEPWTATPAPPAVPDAPPAAADPEADRGAGQPDPPTVSTSDSTVVIPGSGTGALAGAGLDRVGTAGGLGAVPRSPAVTSGRWAGARKDRDRAEAGSAADPPLQADALPTAPPAGEPAPGPSTGHAPGERVRRPAGRAGVAMPSPAAGRPPSPAPGLGRPPTAAAEPTASPSQPDPQPGRLAAPGSTARPPAVRRRLDTDPGAPATASAPSTAGRPDPVAWPVQATAPRRSTPPAAGPRPADPDTSPGVSVHNGPARRPGPPPYRRTPPRPPSAPEPQAPSPAAPQPAAPQVVVVRARATPAAGAAAFWERRHLGLLRARILR